jgi:hypothetical protein
VGGAVKGAAWVNQTILATIPAGLVARLAELDQVAVVDLPRVIRVD